MSELTEQDKQRIDAELERMHQQVDEFLSIEAELATGQAALTTSFGLARREADGTSRTFGGNAAGPISVIADWDGGGYRVEFKTPDGGLNPPATSIASGTTGYAHDTTPKPSQAQIDADYMRNQNKA